MRRRRPGARLILLLLLAGAMVLGVGPAAGEEPLRLVDVSPSDQHVVAVVDVPGSQMPGAPSAEFEVLDGESRLAVEAEAVLQPRRSLTVVVDAAGAGPASGLGELKQAATDLLLRLGTTVEPALVISRTAGPEVLPPGGVAAAVAAVGELRPVSRSGDALVAAVRAAVAGSVDATDGPRVVVVLAASGGEVPPRRLREELSGQQALVHVLAVGGPAQQYWREVVPEGAGEVALSASGPGTGSVVRRLASQHVVSFRKPRDHGSVVLRARTGERVLTATIPLGSTRGTGVGQASGSKRVAVVVVAVLALTLVSVGLLALAARDRTRLALRRPTRAGVGWTGVRHLRNAPGRPGNQGSGRHHRDRHHDVPVSTERGSGAAGSRTAAAGRHFSPSSPRRPAATASGQALAAGGPGGTGQAGGSHVGGREDVPAHTPADLRPGSDTALDADAGADPPDPAAARRRRAAHDPRGRRRTLPNGCSNGQQAERTRRRGRPADGGGGCGCWGSTRG